METLTVNQETLTVRDVAERLGVSKRSVRRYLERFGVPANKVHVGERAELHVRADDVDRLVQLLEAQDGKQEHADLVCDREKGSVGDEDPEGQNAQTRDQPGSAVGKGRALVLRGVTRTELREVLVDAFSEALRKARAAEPVPPRRFQETLPGRIVMWTLYAVVAVMSVGCLAFAYAIARKFDLVGALLG